MFQVTSPGKFIAWILILIIVVGLGVFKLVWGSSTIQHSGEVAIEQGDSAKVVWNKVHQEEFTSRTLPWQFHGWRLDAASQLKTGTYRLEKGEKVKEVIERFISGDITPNELTVTFPEGFTITQMARRVESIGISTDAEFVAATDPTLYTEQFSFVNQIPEGNSLEGYLFPDTYRVHEDDTPEDLIRRMLANFNRKVVESGLEQEAVQSGRSLNEAIIMASIIEREVISDEDMALVSGVLWKRNDEGTGLGADATVRYILDYWDGPLTVGDLQIDSPYNTRRYRGLTPGPISNPGLRAIIASINPEESEYYYYLSAPSGETIFSRTNDEHNQNKVKYLQ